MSASEQDPVCRAVTGSQHDPTAECMTCQIALAARDDEIRTILFAPYEASPTSDKAFLRGFWFGTVNASGILQICRDTYEPAKALEEAERMLVELSRAHLSAGQGG